MKALRNFLLIGLCMIFFLAGCQNKLGTRNEFKYATNIYAEQLADSLLAVKNADASDVQSIVKATDQANEKLKKDYSKYKNKIKPEDLKQKDQKQLYDILTNITEIQTQLFDDLHHNSQVKGMNYESFSKHGMERYYEASFALGNQYDNLKNIDAKNLMNEKVYDKLETYLQGLNQARSENLYAFALSQNKGYYVNPKNLAKIDPVKFSKYKNNSETETVPKATYNKEVDAVNTGLDKDSKLPHVNQDVNVFLLKMLVEKEEMLVRVYQERKEELASQP